MFAFENQKLKQLDDVKYILEVKQQIENMKMELFVLVMMTEVSYSGDEKEVIGVYSSEEKANLVIENIQKNKLQKSGNLGYVDKFFGAVTFSIEKFKLDDM